MPGLSRRATLDIAACIMSGEMAERTKTMETKSTEPGGMLASRSSGRVISATNALTRPAGEKIAMFSLKEAM